MARTVILIDDDPEDLATLKEIITEAEPSLVCISFIYSDEAVRVLLNNELIMVPDLIFIDINMPGLPGDKCLKAIRSNRMYDNVYIAMYSSSMPEAVSDALTRIGANTTFEKPVRMDKYSQIVAQILEQVKVLK